MNRKQILIVDDEAKLRRLLSINLTSLGYEVVCAVDGVSALELFESHQPDLILLDVMMPKMDGLQVLEKIRRNSSVPVILLTAKDQIEDKVKGFDLGADDYLAKPFALEELFSRIRAVLRRTGVDQKSLGNEEPEYIENGQLRVNVAERRVFWGQQEVRLTVNEYNMLEYFITHVNSVLMHEQVFAHVWGVDRSMDLQVLRVTLTRMRSKLREAGMQEDCAIESYSGTGYRMYSLGAK